MQRALALRAPADSTSATGVALAQSQLGNDELSEPTALATLARGGAMLSGLGVPADSISPGAAPLSAMRALMRHAQPGNANLASATQAVARSQGQPLPDAVRARMESAFGRDLSHVRIHTDAAADEAAWDIHALAFALGDHVYFSAGAFQPAGGDGQALLAHELTHVVQHDEGRLPAGGGVSHPSDAHEREASRAADLFTSGFDVSEFLGIEVPTSTPSGAEAAHTPQAPESAPSAGAAAPISREAEEGTKEETSEWLRFEKKKKDDESVQKGGKYDTEGDIQVGSNGVSATAKAEAQYGIGRTVKIPLAAKSFSRLGEDFKMGVELTLSCFAGVVGEVKGELSARWMSGTKANGVPTVDALIDKLNEWLWNRSTNMDATDMSTEDAEVKDQISQSNDNIEKSQHSLDQKNKALKSIKNKKPTKEKRAKIQKGADEDAQSIADNKETLENAKQKQTTKSKMKLTATNPTGDSTEGTKKGKKSKAKSQKARDQKNSTGSNYKTNKDSLEKDKGVTVGAKGELFVGAKAGFGLEANLTWNRKASKDYGIEENFRSMMDTIIEPGSALAAGLGLANKAGGRSGIGKLLHFIAGPFLDFDATEAKLASAKLEADLRMGASAKGALSFGYTGGELRFVAAAGLSWGIGASFETTWGVGLVPGAQLVLVLFDRYDQDLAAFVTEAAARVKQVVTDKVQPFFDLWNAFQGWRSADNRAWQIIDSDELAALSPEARGQLLRDMLDGVLNRIEPNDERCTVLLLEDARDERHDLAAVVASVGVDHLRDKLWWFDDESLRKRAEAAVGAAQEPEPEDETLDPTTNACVNS